jgi:hypothetical protein
VTCEKNDWRVIPLSNLPLQLQPVDVWELDVQDEAGGYVGLGEGDIFGSISESYGAKRRSGQQIHE